MLYSDRYPSAWLHYFLCGCVGMANSFVFITSTQYFTDYAHRPVRDIAAASITGHATNIITGVAWGMKSTAVPALSVSVAVIASYVRAAPEKHRALVASARRPALVAVTHLSSAPPCHTLYRVAHSGWAAPPGWATATTQG